MPFKANAARRHHIPKQKCKVTNWAAYDASLRQRASLTVWFSDDASRLESRAADDARRAGLVFAADPDSLTLSPDDVVREFSFLMKSYGVSRATSDRWGGDWVGEAFRKYQITVEPSAEPKADKTVSCCRY